MKTADQWFAEYAESHQNQTNIELHFVCVPAIYFSIIGMLMSISNLWLMDVTGLLDPFLINWAMVIFIPAGLFYMQLSPSILIRMFVFHIVCMIGNYYLATIAPLFYTNLTIFIVAWIGQFYGHKVEGKKPSFFKDLQFLLIGPVWVMKKMF